MQEIEFKRLLSLMFRAACEMPANCAAKHKSSAKIMVFLWPDGLQHWAVGVKSL
ncbi:hypothetical protein [Rheinheimera sp. SA_1]|uniref:hypothetical protein n=1 Tax=Rheinheimera sp. SA_1 TaxID=1827365 RepID=UPI0018D2BD2E|nr:hypothetical protein [Rheinheimera sp. SA_1]